jgi:solute carrier family 25 citrate transporter 1
MVKKSKNPVVATLAGCTAGGVETLCVWPMEYIKTQLQLAQKEANPKFNGIFSCARYTFRKHGFLTFYRGMAPVLAGSLPKAGIRFGAFTAISDLYDARGSALRTMAAGMTAGALEAVVAVTPVETLKTRLIDGNSGIVRGTVQIVQREGIAGIYKGVGATVAKQSSNQGLRFMAMGQYRQFLTGEASGRQLTPLESLFGGMCAGCFSTMCNNPFDMVKTRTQGLEAHKYNGMFDCFRKVLRHEGPTAFYRGVTARLGRVVPGQGIIFMSYDTISNFYEDKLGTAR